MGKGGAVTLPSASDSGRMQAHLGILFTHAADAMLLVGPDDRIRAANPGAVRLLGAAIEGRPVTDVVTCRSRGLAHTAEDPHARTTAPESCDSTPARDGLRRTVAVRPPDGGHQYMEATVDHLPAAALGEGGQGPFRLVRLRALTPSLSEDRLVAAIERRYRDVLDSVPNLSLLVFDPQLRLRMAAGSLLRRAGYDPDTMVGEPLADVVGPRVMDRVGTMLGRALLGESVDTEYVSPTNGWHYTMRVRPVRDSRGTIVGGLLLSEDVTGPRLLQRQLEQVQRASRVGSVRYVTGRGWILDGMLRDILGLEPDPATSSDRSAADDSRHGPGTIVADASFVMELVLPEDRARVQQAYHKVLTEGGEVTIDYRLRQAQTGALQYVQGNCQAEVDVDGQLLQAVITHADITGAVRALQSAETARAESASARTQLLRQASDLLVDSAIPVPLLVQSVTELAAAGLGDGASVRVLQEHGAGVEADFVAHRDPVARARMTAFKSATAATFDRGSGVDKWIFGRGRCVSSLHPDAVDIVGPAGLTTPHGSIPHFILAPIRYDGAVLGKLGVFRQDPDRPYEPGDDDLTQVLADRLGTVIAQDRTRTWVEQQRRERAAILGRLTRLTAEQRELVDQLGDVEQRERILLAEAIHDDPMQTIVAVAMRIDTLAMALDGEPAQELDTLVSMLESAVNRLRTLIIALNPPDLSEGLGPALLGLAQGIFIGTDTQVRSVGLQHVALSTATKGTVYRIFREALVNVRKHAHAADVEIRLEHDQDDVRATLTDDGVGADSFDSGPGHLGMTTMRARAHAEGGRLTVTGSRGEGTRVMLVLPRKQADEHSGGMRAAGISGEVIDGPMNDRPVRDRGRDTELPQPVEVGP